jgi:Cu2+-exporting ATPase
LAPVAAALAVTRQARQLMRQNLLFAVASNIVAVPIAVLGFASPLVAALATAGAAILITVNALRATPREQR